MNFEIKDKTEALLAKLIASGRYRSIDEIIADAAKRLPVASLYP